MNATDTTKGDDTMIDQDTLDDAHEQIDTQEGLLWVTCRFCGFTFPTCETSMTEICGTCSPDANGEE